MNISKITFLSATILLLGFFSCSEDSLLENENTNTNSEAYCQFKIMLPNGVSTNTRDASAEDSEDYETGVAKEYKVKNVDIYFFSKDGEAGKDGKFKGKGSSTPVGDPVEIANSVMSVVTTKTPGIGVGTYRVYAIANSNVPITVGETTTEKDFLATISNSNNTIYDKGLITASSLDPDNSVGYMMVSRSAGSPSVESKPWVEVTIAADNDEKKPAEFTIEMERVMAKLVVKAGTDQGKNSSGEDNVYSVPYDSDSPYATVEIVDYQVVNLRNDFFVFRHTSPAFEYSGTPTYGFGRIIDAKASGQSDHIYVMDPKTIEKSIGSDGKINAVNYTEWYVNPASAPASTYADMPTGSTPLTMGYCLENTTRSDAQLQGFSTGVLFRGKITPTGIYTIDSTSGTDKIVEITESNSIAASMAGDVYYWEYNHRFYATLDAFKKDTNVTEDNPDGLKKITSGYCYFPYWIKHYDQTELLAPMKFGVVRNNVYVMQIDGIKEIGNGTEPVDPNIPDETDELYIVMTMHIRPWIIRSNEGIIL